MSEAYETFLAGLREPVFVGDEPMEVAREKLESVHGHPTAPDTRIEWTRLSGVRCAWVDTPESDPDRILLLCHGGAFIAAGGDGYLFYAEMLARPCRSRVLLVDYRLAPQHRFPAALDDCVNAYRGLLAAGTPPGSVAFIGDSCGGGLAIATLLQLREAGDPLPACAITLGGWLDLEAEGESARNPLALDPFACRDFVRARARDYLGPEGDARDPRASPIHAALEGLPPLYLQSGQIDLTRDDAVTLAARAGRAGVDVTLEIAPGMIHGYQGLANAGIPESREALDRVGAFLRRHVSGRDSHSGTDRGL